MSCSQQSHHYGKLSPIQEVRVISLELSRLPVLSLFNEKQGILLRENIIPYHSLEPLPCSRAPVTQMPCCDTAQCGQDQCSYMVPTCALSLSLPFILCLVLFVYLMYAYFTRQKRICLRSHNAHKIIKH